ncbi:MAG: SGNH/GDSL hydrolase family protein, partial [Edaphobacter sp.]
MKSGLGIIRSGLLLLFCSLGLPSISFAAPTPAEHWIGTWAASPEAQANTEALGHADMAYREIVHVSAGGSAVRIVLTNEFGLEPLTVGAAQIAISTGGSAIEPATAKALSFGGQPSVTLPAGTMMVSDPVEMKLPALANVVVSLFV